MSIYVIGVGDKIEVPELLDLASDYRNVFVTSNFNTLLPSGVEVTAIMRNGTEAVSRSKFFKDYFRAKFGISDVSITFNLTFYLTRGACEVKARDGDFELIVLTMVIVSRVLIYIYIFFTSHTLLDRICNLPSEPGQLGCLASITAHYFEASLGECQKFIYSGCGGNANNFPTYKKCMDNCKGR